MKVNFLFLLFLILLSPIILGCENGQIDINSASLEELDQIIWVGEATAQKIIDIRPFDSVDDLVKVSGIGETKLQAIKEQDLACVEETQTQVDDEEIEENEKKETEEHVLDITKVSEPSAPTTGKMIDLTQSIKSENNRKILNKDNYAVYGLAGFCVLLGFLFILRRRRFRKNEFG